MTISVRYNDRIPTGPTIAIALLIASAALLTLTPDQLDQLADLTSILSLLTSFLPRR